MATFVLIHGACHGAWCWERVAPLLEAHGHRVVAPDLPGMGEDRTSPQTVTADLWTEFVVDLLGRQKGPVVLVGHSRAGMQISAAAESAPGKVRLLVYLTAFVPRDGQTNLELAMSYCSREMLTGAGEAQQKGEGGFPAGLAKAIFYNTTEDVWADRATAKLCAEPAAPMMSPVHLTAARFGAVRKAYIECLEDRAIPIANQRKMQAHAVFEAVLQLPTDHSPFYSAPDLLVERLLRAAS